MNELQNRRRALMALGNGGGGMKITSYTTTSGDFNTDFNNAVISPIAENEILIWNIRGTVQQFGGTAGAKFGVVVLQNGRVVTNSSAYKRMESVVAPDSATPANSWSDFYTTISNGKYSMGSGTVFYVGVGNVIDFVQIPYNIGWNV